MIAGRVSLGVEYDLRERMYGQLQRLELGFFDHQQTGQLMSRATVDLAAVRFFLGYGLVFILQSILTIALAGAVMLAINPRLGAIALVPVPFVVAISYRYGRRARPAIQETQQRIAELTADAEENISGVRVVKAFAREERQLTRFQSTVGRVFSQAMVATRLEARYNPMIGFLPQLGLAAVLLLGGESVIHAHLALGQVHGDLTRGLGLGRVLDERHGLLGQHHRQQPGLGGVGAEDVAEPRRDHRAEAVVEQRPDRVLPRRPGPEVRARHQDRGARVARLVEHERRVLAPGGEQPVAEPLAGDPLEVDGGDDLVGVHVRAP